MKVIWSGRLENNQELVHYEFFPGECHSCCDVLTGNVDCDSEGGVDISDISALIDYLYISYRPLCCSHAADTDADFKRDLSDLTRLIDRLYISFEPLAQCGQ